MMNVLNWVAEHWLLTIVLVSIVAWAYVAGGVARRK